MATTRGEQWYVIFCKPRLEDQVGHYLDSKGFETYCPTCLVQPDDTHPAQIKPFFPRYLFVRADLEATGTSVLNWIPGAVGLVTYGDTPASVPQHIIDELKKRLSTNEQTILSPMQRISCGESVRIVRGPLSGYDAVFDSRLSGSQRVRVLLQMLDRQVQVTLSANAIEARSNLNS